MKNLNWKTIGIYIAIVFLTISIGLSGVTKLMGMQEWIEQFEIFGYPLWFLYFAGVVQIVGAIMLWIPKMRFWGGALFVITMAVAAFSNFNIGEYGSIPIDIVLLLLSALITWIGRDSAMLLSKVSESYGAS
ncbi:MAG: DoxX family protein [Chloroflexota bacterium]